MGNNKKINQIEPTLSERVSADLLLAQGARKTVSLSVIVPTYNCSESIGTTLESIKQQTCTPLEVILVDAGSTDRTLEVAAGYSSLISRIYSVTQYNVADMMNRGISLAGGNYITFLHPGTYYLSCYTYQIFSEQIELKKDPHLIYCGSIQREIKREPKTILFPFSLSLLESGIPFATTSACWFRSDLFDQLGKFNTKYSARSSFDFFCRMGLANFEPVMISRIFVDFDYGRFSYGKVIRSSEETWRILYRHFGMRKSAVWFFTFNHFQIFKWLWSRFKLHLSKR